MEWIKIKDRVPYYKDGPGGNKSNKVFVRWDRTVNIVGFSDIEYILKYPDEITHWMYIPEVEQDEPPLTNEELKELREILSGWREQWSQ